MFTRISQKDIDQINGYFPNISQSVETLMENLHYFLDQLLKIAPKNDFMEPGSCYALTPTELFLEKNFPTLGNLSGSPYIEGNELLEISFWIHIPSSFFPTLEVEKSIGLYSEVGKEPWTLHLAGITEDKIIAARENAQICKVGIPRQFARIILKVSTSGVIELDFYQDDRFGEFNLNEYTAFYEMYFVKLRPILEQLHFSSESKIKIIAPGDLRQNQSKETRYSIEGTLTLKDCLLMLKTIHSLGFMIGEFPKLEEIIA